MSEYMSTDIDKWGRYKSLGKFYSFSFFKKLRKNRKTHRIRLRGNFGHLREEKKRKCIIVIQKSKKVIGSVGSWLGRIKGLLEVQSHEFKVEFWFFTSPIHLMGAGIE